MSFLPSRFGILAEVILLPLALLIFLVGQHATDKQLSIFVLDKCN
jgi:hypothetical protein